MMPDSANRTYTVKKLRSFWNHLWEEEAFHEKFVLYDYKHEEPWLPWVDTHYEELKIEFFEFNRTLPEATLVRSLLDTLRKLIVGLEKTVDFMDPTRLEFMSWFDNGPEDTKSMDWLENRKRREELRFYHEYFEFLSLKLKESQEKEGAPNETATGWSLDHLSEKKEVILGHLEPLKAAFRDDADYYQAVKELVRFFEDETNTNMKPVTIRPWNKKKLAKVLWRIHHELEGTSIPLSYLKFSKALFSNFSDEIINMKDPYGSNLYRYMTEGNRSNR